MAKQRDGWPSRKMDDTAEGLVAISRGMGGQVERWVAKQRDGWL